MAERLDAFMARANAAFYAARDPLAEFTTAPEISQVFGELLGLWAAVTWQAMGAPGRVVLAELGPGRGSLMADALRAIGRAMPGFAAALELHLVETSPTLRAAQMRRLPGATWHDGIATLPPGPMIVLANEMLDALPIRQFVRRGAGWAERFVADGAFVECPAQPPRPLPRAAEGAVVEAGDAARALVGALAARLARQGGAALFVDYGPAMSAAGDSLQALRGGRPADPLLDPGAADLTAHVDFAALAEMARSAGASVFGPLPQGRFLVALGLYERVAALARGKPVPVAVALMEGARRLAEPDRMGTLFKALAVCDPALPPPPGFPAP